MSQIFWPAHCISVILLIHIFTKIPPSYLLPSLISITLSYFWNHITLFKIHLLLRTSWLSVWKKYFFLTLEHNHRIFTEIPAKQNKTWDLLTQLQTSLYICFLSKEYYQKKLPKLDPMLLSISFLNRNKIINLGRVSYFYSHLEVRPILYHWYLESLKCFPYRKIGNLTQAGMDRLMCRI